MKELDNIRELYLQEMSKVNSMEDLNNVRTMFLGKAGHLTTCMKLIKDMSVEDKKAFGVGVNELKTEVSTGIENKNKELLDAKINEELNSMPKVDLTTPLPEKMGRLHPVTIIQQRIVNI